MVCDNKTQLQRYCRLIKSYFNQIRPARFKITKSNKNKMMTMGYVAVIFVAFILSLANNNDVNASLPKSDSISYMMLEAALNENEYNSVYPENSLDNVKSLFDMVNKKFSKTVEKEIVVKRGDSLVSIFNRIGLDKDAANSLFAKVKPVYNTSSLKAGQKISVSMLIDSEDSHFISLESFILPENNSARIVIEKADNGDYIVRKEKDELIDEVNSISGKVNGALSVSMRNAGISGKIIANFSNIFSRSVNFRKDIHKGDTFKIIYEQKINAKGDVVHTGNILYAALIMRKNKVELYRFKDSSGNVQYYNATGSAMQKTLHRKPLAFQSARISSPFGKRFHPILRKYKIHWGVDYAAPAGTPVYAAGEGVVEAARYNGGYGNYVKIRHNSQYSTAYGHMKSIARGIRPGVRVKQGQVIAYVGSTGRSTGSHLHYEIIQNGKRVNPLTTKAAAGADLSGQSLKKFKQQVAQLQATHKKLFANATTAGKVAKK